MIIWRYFVWIRIGTLELCPMWDIYWERRNLSQENGSRKECFSDRSIPWNITNVTPNVTLVTFSMRKMDYGLWNIPVRTNPYSDPRTNSGVLRKCPTWDIIPRSPFVSMKDISRLSWNLQNMDLRARAEENGLWIIVLQLGFAFQTRPIAFLVHSLSTPTWNNHAVVLTCSYVK